MPDGQFAGGLGDLMVLTLANILNTPITLFTSIENMPLLCVTPTTQAADTTHFLPICTQTLMRKVTDVLVSGNPRISRMGVLKNKCAR